MVLLIEEYFDSSLENSPETFLADLRQELQYFQRTKIVTLLDIYRIRKRLLPMLDAWLDLHELTYKSLLKLHENLLFHALRYEENLSDVNKMVYENKYVLRNGIRSILEILPVVV